MKASDFFVKALENENVKYSESYGAHGHRVNSSQSLLPLIQNCLAAPGVHLIEVPVDYSENDQILNHQIQKLSAQL